MSATLEASRTTQADIPLVIQEYRYGKEAVTKALQSFNELAQASNLYITVSELRQKFERYGLSFSCYDGVSSNDFDKLKMPLILHGNLTMRSPFFYIPNTVNGNREEVNWTEVTIHADNWGLRAGQSERPSKLYECYSLLMNLRMLEVCGFTKPTQLFRCDPEIKMDCTADVKKYVRLLQMLGNTPEYKFYFGGVSETMLTMLATECCTNPHNRNEERGAHFYDQLTSLSWGLEHAYDTTGTFRDNLCGKFYRCFMRCYDALEALERYSSDINRAFETVSFQTIPRATNTSSTSKSQILPTTYIEPVQTEMLAVSLSANSKIGRAIKSLTDRGLAEYRILDIITPSLNAAMIQLDRSRIAPLHTVISSDNHVEMDLSLDSQRFFDSWDDSYQLTLQSGSEFLLAGDGRHLHSVELRPDFKRYYRLDPFFLGKLDQLIPNNHLLERNIELYVFDALKNCHSPSVKNLMNGIRSKGCEPVIRHQNRLTYLCVLLP